MSGTGGEMMNGYYDDDGNPMNPNIVPKPSLCISCKHDDDPGYRARSLGFDQQGEEEFRCEAYVEKG